MRKLEMFVTVSEDKSTGAQVTGSTDEAKKHFKG
jgi:hypothetical protein